MTPPKTYIGDSVYAEAVHEMLKLTTNNGYPDDPRNVIYLGIAEWKALENYVKRIREAAMKKYKVEIFASTANEPNGQWLTMRDAFNTESEAFTYLESITGYTQQSANFQVTFYR